ncbi:hypothetical protein HYX70_03450 [Candidatus Saccharibacteria bacterium]|nr:hypothetical protein [Candidatus Saccharibacteria bacterium]
MGARNAADDPTKKPLHAYLSKKAHDAWQEASDEAGVSMSALLEAIGLSWAEKPPTEDAEWFDAIAGRARKIDTFRRRR